MLAEGMPDRAQLADRLSQVAAGARGAKHGLRAFFEQHAGVLGDEVAVSLATGGTKQLRNRLGQAEIRRSKQLAILLLDEPRHLDPCIGYVAEAARGRNNATPPAGPVAFAHRDENGQWTVAAVVASRPTAASALLGRLFSLRTVDPTESVTPVLPVGVRSWLFMSRADTAYGDIDGVRYHFPTRIPNGRQIQAGDIAVTARIQRSAAADARQIFGIGRIGRRVEGPTDAYVYFDRFAWFDPPVELQSYGDPRRNVNAMTAVAPDWVVGLLKILGVESVDELPVPFTALTLGHLRAELRARQLVFSDDLLLRTLAALRAGKHVMFTGPPGTGKTSLALAVAAAAARAGLGDEPVLTTGTSDWTSTETVGAYRLARDQELRFRPGHVLAAIEQDRWLVIDELNRADIDKAIGQLFTVLSGQAVLLPFEESREEGELPIAIVPPGAPAPEGTAPRSITSNWRLLATLNDRDRDLLFDMSEALMRRFAIIEVGPPDARTWVEIFRVCRGTGNPRWDAALTHLVTSDLLAARPVGAAVVLDCIRHLIEVTRMGEEFGTAVDEVAALQDALDLYIKPQVRTIASDPTVYAGKLLAVAAGTSPAPRSGDAGEDPGLS